MPQLINNIQVFSLYEVTKSIEKTLASRYGSPFWVKAEMIRLNHYKHSGHCYPDLVEKKEGRVIAQIRATLWADNYERINRRFLKITKEPLKDGITIMFSARINYHPVHGLSLHILDIDPSFTLGEMEREKQEAIAKLQQEGVFYLNKEMPFPLLPQRIAVISVETSKGYADFISVIENNPWEYRFFHMLFPSLLQGEDAVPSIIKQLERIRKVKSHFDVVTIIRGGGGDVGLSCYNNYYLAKEVATFPLPVLTGIGHSTNETVVEMVANQNNITPTKLAEFLIQSFHNLSVPLKEKQEKITEIAGQLIYDAQTSINRQSEYLAHLSRNILENNHNRLTHLVSTQNIHLKNFLSAQRKELEQIENKISILNPANVLKRGYSMTFLNNKSLTEATTVKEGDQITTRLFKGEIISIVQSKKEK